MSHLILRVTVGVVLLHVETLLNAASEGKVLWLQVNKILFILQRGRGVQNTHVSKYICST